MSTMPAVSPHSQVVTDKLRITVLAGGPSAEREVSLQSGAAIAAALRRRGHDVHVADINADDCSALDRRANVIFSALHGTFGEDGQLQSILERRGIAFVGSDAAASRCAIDKVHTKQRAIAAGIDTPEFVVLDSIDLSAAQRLLDAGPVVVKPVDQGSSVLTTVVRRREDFEPAVRAVIDAYGRALVERCILGDEITVGILGEQPLPPICIRTQRGFYDYQAKYVDDDTKYLFDAGHSPAMLERAQNLSLRIFDLLGCRHLARVDWMVDRDERLWFLEINTLPGFTSHSLVPKAAARIGISFDALCDRLARMALTPRGVAP
ncbi:MAG: D-alanine--D-alanine ligase [Phycisphaerae bacterium]